MESWYHLVEALSDECKVPFVCDFQFNFDSSWRFPYTIFCFLQCPQRGGSTVSWKRFGCVQTLSLRWFIGGRRQPGRKIFLRERMNLELTEKYFLREFRNLPHCRRSFSLKESLTTFDLCAIFTFQSDGFSLFSYFNLYQ